MAKPAITKRTTKGSALTYSELDTNFQNLADATVSLTAGTGGTAVTADLNGNITLVAGTNISLTGDNTAKTLTITGTASVTGLTNPLTSNLDVASFNIFSSTGNVNLGDDINFPSGGGPFVPGAGTLLCRGGNIHLTSTGNVQLTVSNDPGLILAGATVNQTPSNTTIPVSWLKITVNGGTRYIPLYS